MSQRVDDLIQLMRLSGTDKVREYLEEWNNNKITDKQFLSLLEHMFQQCKRDSIAEAWPPQP